VRKLTTEALEAISTWIDAQPDLTLQAICSRLIEEHQITVSQKTISTALTRLGFTFKLSRLIPMAWDSPTVIASRIAYVEQFHQSAPLDPRDILWVDETGFNLHLRRRHGRARVGQRVNLVVPTNRGRNISICAAMSADGFIAHRVQLGAYNAALFCDFLEILFVRLREVGRINCRIVLDNVRFHHCAVVRDFVERAGHMLHFLPPYSPMLNPIEPLFGKWKCAIRTQGLAFSQEVLLESIERARGTITINDCLGWIREVNRNSIQCLRQTT
jgi:transposase